MLNSNEWQQRHDKVLDECLALLDRSQDCLAHLEMIADDKDALKGLQTTLRSLTEKAVGAALHSTAAFARQLQEQLESHGDGLLQHEALRTLKDCLGLLAWQLELIDPRTGELTMDDSEQHELLTRLAGLTRPATPEEHAIDTDQTKNTHA